MAKRAIDSQSLPPIRVAPLGEQNAYCVSEHELEKLAAGSPATLSLNFGLSLFFSGISLLATLVTAEFGSNRLYFTFLTICLVFLINGSLLLMYWWKHYDSTRKLLNEIKARMPPPPGIKETSDPKTSPPS